MGVKNENGETEKLNEVKVIQNVANFQRKYLQQYEKESFNK